VQVGEFILGEAGDDVGLAHLFGALDRARGTKIT
jgi:hypothetical protein